MGNQHAFLFQSNDKSLDNPAIMCFRYAFGVGRGAFGRLLIFSKLGNDPLFLYQAPRLVKHSMLNSAEHEVLNAHKYKNIKKFGFF